MRKALVTGWLCLLVSSIVLFPSLWSGHATWYTDDLINLNIPQRVLLGNLYAAGKTALWNPYSFAGQPLLASIQSGPLYPPNLVFLVLPLTAALNSAYLFHWCLGAFGMYAYLLRLRVRPIFAFTGAFLFGTCGFSLAHVMHTQMIEAVAWIPVVFALAESYSATKQQRYAFLLSLAIVLQLLAGHPQISFYTALLLVPYLFTIRATGPFIWVAAASAALVSGAQLVPTWELITLSVRQVVSYEFFSAGSMPVDWWSAVVFPFLHGGGYTRVATSGSNDWEFVGYCGFLALSVAVASLISYRWHRQTFFWVAAAVVGVVLALGSQTPLYHYLYKTPGFNWFRIPARYVLFLDVAVPVLAALGLNALGKSRKGLALFSIFAVGGTWAAYVLAAVHWTGESSYSIKLAQSAYLVPVCFVVVAVLAVWGIVAAAKARPAAFAPWISLMLTVAVLAENFLYAATVNGYALKPVPVVTSVSPIVTYLQGVGGTPFRVASFANVLMLERGARYGIETLNGYDSLYTRNYAEYVNLMWSYDPLFRSKAYLDLLNTRYAITTPDTSVWPMQVTDQPSEAGTPTQPLWSNPNQLWVSPSLPAKMQTGIQEIIVSYHDSQDLNELNKVFDPDPIPYTDGHLAIVSAASSAVSAVGGPSSASARAVDASSTLPLAGADGRSVHLQVNPAKSVQQIWVRNDLWSGTLTIDSIGFVRTDGSTFDLQVHQNLTVPSWGPVFSANDGIVYQNPTAYPRFFGAVPGDWQVPLQNAAVSIEQRDSDHASLKVDFPQQGQLVMSQLYYPGWEASIDGHAPTPVTQTDFVSSIEVPAGVHQVTFAYQPKTWIYGLYLTLLGLLIWVLWILLALKRRVW